MLINSLRQNMAGTTKSKSKSMCFLLDDENTSPNGRVDVKSARHSMPTPMRAREENPADAKIQELLSQYKKAQEERMELESRFSSSFSSKKSVLASADEPLEDRHCGENGGRNSEYVYMLSSEVDTLKKRLEAAERRVSSIDTAEAKKHLDFSDVDKQANGERILSALVIYIRHASNQEASRRLTVAASQPEYLEMERRQPPPRFHPRPAPPVKLPAKTPLAPKKPSALLLAVTVLAGGCLLTQQPLLLKVLRPLQDMAKRFSWEAITSRVMCLALACAQVKPAAQVELG
ncbi:hypothetical protein GUITHDRAFT_117278 [Guillardia theta CCMP2712]|uniref:Uncharacterized protein n=1 Tax=Guillardia theta (strain CCMP2712) TaxID=905079 RepID=L1IL25_GUITC|nr:hypothetical protein GUITHDRAFT_117278 [Guillardia theta CCMP2712]EKX36500.1 hypothetical protein GUITHDRAFT_117278 [Guillardia theta CCMP2712]|eukprot:XP_005823480.1 hypothetical protein GUITHDRAFT_117278 [Guillardia theta CCMP2712]